MKWIRQQAMAIEFLSRRLTTTCALSTILVCFYGYHVMQGRRLGVLPSVSNALEALRTFQAKLDPMVRNSTIAWNGLGFLKVHKAASTTTQSIFLRFGWRRNMTFVLPHEHNAFSYPNIISINETLTEFNIVASPLGRQFDILCHHVFYDRQAWNKVLSPSAAKVGTIREPLSVFQSVLRYFKPSIFKLINSRNPVRVFLKNPYYYDRNVKWSFMNNRMALEYGVDPDVIKTRDFARFEKYLFEVLDKDFAIVIVTEKFDQSLVMMKRLLNWTLNDILYIPKNMRVRNRKGSPDFEPTKEDMDLHKRFAVFDYILYDFFKKKLDKQISLEPRFYDEVEHFKNVSKLVSQFCFRNGLTDFPPYILSNNDSKDAIYKFMTINRTEWNESFKISREDCFVMYADEIDFTQAIRKKQYGTASWKWLR